MGRLLDAGADPNTMVSARGATAFNPLAYCCERAHLGSVRKLLECRSALQVGGDLIKCMAPGL